MTQQFATIDRRTDANHTPPLTRTHPTHNVLQRGMTSFDNSAATRTLAKGPTLIESFSFRKKQDEEAFLSSLVESGLEYRVQVQAINLTREQAHRTTYFNSLVYTLKLLSELY